MSGAGSQTPTIVRIWRATTPRHRADEYEPYLYEAGIKPLVETALGVQTSREDRQHETESLTISYAEDVEAMQAFTGGDPEIHHLERDAEFLVELPRAGAGLATTHEPRRDRGAASDRRCGASAGSRSRRSRWCPRSSHLWRCRRRWNDE